MKDALLVFEFLIGAERLVVKLKLVFLGYCRVNRGVVHWVNLKSDNLVYEELQLLEIRIAHVEGLQMYFGPNLVYSSNELTHQ